MIIYNNLFNIKYIYFKFCIWGNIMAVNNVAILNILYNYIDKNKHGVGNRIHVPNTDPLLLLPPQQNNRGINNLVL